MKDFITKMRDFYSFKPDAGIVQEEFGFYCLERWKAEGHITGNTDLRKLFGYDVSAKHNLGGLGWCEAAFVPGFTEEVLEDRGQYELVRDIAGRGVLCFKGRRSGFMPEYVDHPVKDLLTWERDVKWRLNPDSPARYANLSEIIKEAEARAKEGYIICQSVIGGYMYLRSLMGPVELLYLLYDAPELIHDCMETWFNLLDRVIAEYQKYVTIDELFLAEDICYNHGLLISPDLVRAFLFPYYQQLIFNMRKRQLDKKRKMILQIDTDGNCLAAIDLYEEIGMNYMSPFEVAAGCDVVAIRQKYPSLLMRGGIDKRILAAGKDAIDCEIKRIMPFMAHCGGYIPVCDHGVPAEVSYENYMHYRKRMMEYS